MLSFGQTLQKHRNDKKYGNDQAKNQEKSGQILFTAQSNDQPYLKLAYDMFSTTLEHNCNQAKHGYNNQPHLLKSPKPLFNQGDNVT